MTKATSVPKVDRAIRLRDGRRMAYSEWGDLAGRPVVWLHGSPASRLICPDEDACEAAGVRFITMDRPGYGRSDPRPDRTLLDWPDDFVELADQLDLPPCPVVGWSSGGPYAMALGFSAPDRVTTVGLAASVGPIQHVPGALDEFALERRAGVELLARDRVAGSAAVRGDATWMEGNGWESMFAQSWGEADDRVLADRATLDALKAFTREAARQGSAGLAADDIAEYSPWGFSVAEIRKPVHIWSGATDRMVGPNHASYLAATIPGATLITIPDAGHLLPIGHLAEILADMH